MKIHYAKQEPLVVTILPKDIPIGTTFITSSLAGEGHVYLRTFSNITSLNDPEKTWNPNNMTNLLDNYRVVNAEVVILP